MHESRGPDSGPTPDPLSFCGTTLYLIVACFNVVYKILFTCTLSSIVLLIQGVSFVCKLKNKLLSVMFISHSSCS